MDPRLRIVTGLPLAELWNEAGPVPATRGPELDAPQVSTCLREGATGVVARIGEPLLWVRGVELFDWWKAEAKPRLTPAGGYRYEDVPNPPPRPPNAYRLEDFPDEHAWTASRWTLADGSVVVVFEEHH